MITTASYSSLSSFSSLLLTPLQFVSSIWFFCYPLNSFCSSPVSYSSHLSSLHPYVILFAHPTHRFFSSLFFTLLSFSFLLLIKLYHSFILLFSAILLIPNFCSPAYSFSCFLCCVRPAYHPCHLYHISYFYFTLLIPLAHRRHASLTAYSSFYHF